MKHRDRLSRLVFGPGHSGRSARALCPSRGRQNALRRAGDRPSTEEDEACNNGPTVQRAPIPMMRAEDQKRSIHHRLVNRILQGPGRAPADQRARAFDNAELPEPLHRLLDKVATDSAQVTDADFATAWEAGFTDDQLFELVICAAVGRSTRQYDAGLAALAEATADAETR
jgi:hypothetical protein